MVVPLRRHRGPARVLFFPDVDVQVARHLVLDFFFSSTITLNRRRLLQQPVDFN